MCATEAPRETGLGLGPEPTPGRPARILAAARAVFQEHGYAGGSVDAVAAQAGVSKATVYAHFDSKERLFGEVLIQARRMLQDRILDLVSAEADTAPAEVLGRIGRAFLRHVTDPQSQRLLRVVIGESARFPQFGQQFVNFDSSPLQDPIGQCLARMVGERGGRLAEPRLAARQFLALIKSDIHIRALLDTSYRPSDAEIDRAVDNAIAILTGYYGGLTE